MHLSDCFYLLCDSIIRFCLLPSSIEYTAISDRNRIELKLSQQTLVLETNNIERKVKDILQLHSEDRIMWALQSVSFLDATLKL